MNINDQPQKISEGGRGELLVKMASLRVIYSRTLAKKYPVETTCSSFCAVGT